MKKIIFLLFIIILIIVCLYSAVMFYLNTKGKEIFLESIHDNLGIDASVESVTFKFPFKVEVKKFTCGNDLFIEQMRINVGGYNLFSSQMTLSKVIIDGLKLKIKRQNNAIAIDKIFSKDLTGTKNVAKESALAFEVKEKVAAVESKKNIKGESLLKVDKFSVEVKRLFFNNATIEFQDFISEDKAYESENIKPYIFIFKNVNANIRHITYPDLRKFFINAKADFSSQDKDMKNFIAIDGWANLPRKCMDINISIRKLDYVCFDNYYPKFFKVNNLGVKDAALSLDTKLKAEDNNLIINLLASLDDISFKDAVTQEETDKIQWLKTILSLLKGSNDKPSIQIDIKTKMDKPYFDFSQIRQQISGMIKIDPFILLNQMLSKAEKIITSGAKGTKEIAIDKTVSTLKGTLKGLGDVLKSTFEAKEEANLDSTQQEPQQEVLVVSEEKKQ